MQIQFLSEQTKLTKVADHTTAGTSDVNSTGIDMQGFEGVQFFTSFGTAAANNGIHLEQSDDNGSTDSWGDLTGTSVLTGASPSNEDVYADCYKPTKRYVRAVASPGTSSTVESIWAIQYGARTLPVSSLVSGTLTGERHVSPAEGTA